MPSVPSTIPTTDTLPCGFDWADGLRDGFGRLRPGTPLPANALKIVSSLGANQQPIEESPESPTLERAEQCTVTHKFTCSYTEGKNRWLIYPRGTLVYDSGGNFYRVLSCKLQKQKGNTATLELTSEAMSFDNPPDEFQINPVKLGLDLLKHPRYFSALMPTNQIPDYAGTPDSPAESNAKQAIIRAIQAYRENPFFPTAQAIDLLTGSLHDTISNALVTGKIITSVICPNFSTAYPATAPCPVGTNPPAIPSAGNNPKYQYVYVDYSASAKVQMAMAAAREIIAKLWRMEDTPLVNGWEIIHVEYWWVPPYLNPGGYIEDPRNATPPLPDYFVSTDRIPSGNTIFDKFSAFNPQCFSTTGRKNGPVSISWLRDADTVEFNRTFFKVTRRWLGAPIGAWDGDLYTTLNRPEQPSDYRNLILA